VQNGRVWALIVNLVWLCIGAVLIATHSFGEPLYLLIGAILALIGLLGIRKVISRWRSTP